MLNKGILMQFPVSQCATYNNMAHKHEGKKIDVPSSCWMIHWRIQTRLCV